MFPAEARLELAANMGLVALLASASPGARVATPIGILIRSSRRQMGSRVLPGRQQQVPWAASAASARRAAPARTMCLVHSSAAAAVAQVPVVAAVVAPAAVALVAPAVAAVAAAKVV